MIRRAIRSISNCTPKSTCRTPDALNTANLFPAPIAANWSRGQYQFNTPIDYGDHKHNGDDYLAAFGSPVVAGGVGVATKCFRAPNVAEPVSTGWLSQAERDRAFTDLSFGYVYRLRQSDHRALCLE